MMGITLLPTLVVQPLGTAVSAQNTIFYAPIRRIYVSGCVFGRYLPYPQR